MNYEVLGVNHFKMMPWKNGEGSTLELYRIPDAIDFNFRLSVATIAKAGPFSLFPEYHRILIPLSGPLLTLRFAEKDVTLTNGVPFSFNGAEPVNATLDGAGPVTDFNIMIKKATGKCVCSPVLKQDYLSETEYDKQVFFYLHVGSANLTIDEAKDPVALTEQALCVINGAKKLAVEMRQNSAALIIEYKSV